MIPGGVIDIDRIPRGSVRTCRICGCTDERGCAPHDTRFGVTSCWWVDIDLCSFCKESQGRQDREPD